MHISRRHLLAGVTSVVALGAAGRLAIARETGHRVHYLSCADDTGRGHHFVGFDVDGQVLFELPLPARGHGMTVSPDGRIAVVFGRRPGLFALVVDLAKAEVVRTVKPMDSRFFFGHGVYSADGTRLFVTESNIDTGDGVIGIYDVANGYVRLDEYAAGGIGPHEIRLAPDNATLAVAIGGILTSLTRNKLNLPTMKPALAYVDSATGELLEKVEPPAEWHQLSIRHIDLDAAGRVAIAMQYQGDAGESVPLVALHQRGEPLTYLRAPELTERRLKHYVGSIAFDESGTWIGATSPRGNILLMWKADTLAYYGAADAKDVCGLARAPHSGFIATGGSGAMWGINAKVHAEKRKEERLWDNHFIAIRNA